MVLWHRPHILDHSVLQFRIDLFLFNFDSRTARNAFSNPFLCGALSQWLEIIIIIIILHFDDHIRSDGGVGRVCGARARRFISLVHKFLAMMSFRQCQSLFSFKPNVWSRHWSKAYKTHYSNRNRVNLRRKGEYQRKCLFLAPSKEGKKSPCDTQRKCAICKILWIDLSIYDCEWMMATGIDKRAGSLSKIHIFLTWPIWVVIQP